MEKTKSKGKLGVILVGILIVVLGGAFIIYYQFFMKDQNVFQTAISEAFDYLSGKVTEYNSISGTFSVDVDLTTNDSEAKQVLDVLKEIDLAGSYGIDYEQKLMNLDLTSQYEGSKLLDAKLYYENQYAYLYLNDVYDKYIKMEIEDYDKIFEGNKNQKDGKIVLESFKKALQKSLKDEYFTKEDTTLDGKKVMKTTLVLDKKTMTEIRESVVNELKQDNEFLRSYAHISGTTGDEVKNSLDELLSEEIEDATMNVVMYTKGKGVKTEFLRLELTDASSKISIYPKDNKYILEVYENDSLLFDGSMLLTGDDKDQTLTLSIHDVESGTEGDIVIHASASYNGTISKQDVSNNVDMNSMSQDEMMGIITKLSQNDGIVKLIEKLGM